MADATPLDPEKFLRDHVAPRSRRHVEALRAEIARLDTELSDRLAAEATIQLVLEGNGGATWYLNLRAGDTQVADTAALPPVMRVYQSREDWEALAQAELAAGGEVGGGGQPAGRDLTRSRLDRMQGLAGALEFRMQAEDGERRILVQFGPGERTVPRCTLRLRVEDAHRLGSGELSPQAAFLQGLVKLEGDLAFAMQVGAALFM